MVIEEKTLNFEFFLEIGFKLSIYIGSLLSLFGHENPTVFIKDNFFQTLLSGNSYVLRLKVHTWAKM